MKKRNTFWRWWAKSLGEKPSKCDRESDKIALIRTFIFATYLITNCFIVAGVIRHWDDKTTVEVYINGSEVPSILSTEEKEGILQTNSGRLSYD